jgi:hypothetical protein
MDVQGSFLTQKQQQKQQEKNSNNMLLQKSNLRFRARILVQTMPMGNSMPMMATGSSMIVDAHSVPDLTIEAAIPQISQALPIALSNDEITLRKQIATKVQITMGSKIMHVEKDIDPRTGTVDIDWTFSAMDAFASELSDQTRIQSHVVMHIYTEHTNSVEEQEMQQQQKRQQQYVGAEASSSVQSFAQANSPIIQRKNRDPKFCYLTGCEVIHLPALMQHVIDVNTGKINTATQREYDFPVQHNFCATFNLCTVVPFETPLTQKEIQQMQSELDIFKGGIAAYEMEAAAAKREGRDPMHIGHAFMPSPLRCFLLFLFFVCVCVVRVADFTRSHTPQQNLCGCRHLPDVETMVRLQQGLQQVYCSNLVRSSDILLKEPNAPAFATGDAFFHTFNTIQQRRQHDNDDDDDDDDDDDMQLEPTFSRTAWPYASTIQLKSPRTGLPHFRSSKLRCRCMLPCATWA